MRKKILIFHPHFTIAGGAGTFVLEVGKRLHDLGYQAIVICIKQDLQITEAYQNKINFIEIGGSLSSDLKHWLTLPYFIYKIYRIANAVKAEIIFPQVFPANWWAFIYVLLSRNQSYQPKVVWMCQEPSAFIHSKKWIEAINSRFKRFLAKVLNPVFKLIDLHLVKQANFVFANSKYCQDYASKVYKLKSEKLSHVYLAADSNFYLGTAAANFSDRSLQITTVCRLTKFKNVDFLIKAIAQINQNFRLKIKLKIVGLGEEKLNLEMLTNELNLNEQIEFCGAVSKSELINILNNSRAFVLASVDEPFGLSIVEALACGTPAIAFNSGGPSEIILDSNCGFLLPALNSDSFVEAVYKLCTDAELFEKYSKQAQERANLFNWDLTTSIFANKFSNWSVVLYENRKESP